MEPFPEIPGIHAVAIDLPGYSDLRTANIFIVGSGPVAVIDTGPLFPGSFEDLRRAFTEIGLGFADIELMLITHGHIDHYGMAMKVREAAGRHVPCYIHEEDEWRLGPGFFSSPMIDDESRRYMALVDMPEDEVRKISRRFSFFRKLADPIPDALPMKDGDIFSGNGYTLRVIHTPGHSPGSCCFYEPEREVLFSGDTVIKHITPNPLHEIKRSMLRDPGYQSLERYTESLARLEAMECRYAFPGHWEHISDLKGIIISYRVHHRERMERIWSSLRKQPRPLYHIIHEVFDFIPEHDVFLAVSETLVHLEMLVNEGRAVLADPGPPAVYHAV